MLDFRVISTVPTILEAFGEPDPGAAGPRAARTRPGDSPAAGQEPPPIRGGDQPRRRAERRRSAAGRRPCIPDLCCSRSSAAIGCRRWSRSRRASRSTTSRRSRNGRTSPGCGCRSICTCPRAWSTWRGASAKTTRFTSARSGATTRSATRCGSRSSIAVARRLPAPARARRGAPARAARQQARGQRPRSARHAPCASPRRVRDEARAAQKRARSGEAPVVAFLRFSRDKRGYENFYLVQPTNRRGKSRPRMLYWFRTPPNVKVGREPFDPDVRRALEAQNPDVTFDWHAIARHADSARRDRALARAPSAERARDSGGGRSGGGTARAAPRVRAPPTDPRSQTADSPWRAIAEPLSPRSMHEDAVLA